VQRDPPAAPEAGGGDVAVKVGRRGVPVIDPTRILGTWPGLYATQSFIHSLVAALVAEVAIRSWRVRDPAARQRIIISVIVLPVFLFPAYDTINPARRTIAFRMGALFDSGRWINMSLPWGLSLGLFLLAIFALTTVIFLLQELIPIVRHALSPSREGAEGIDATRGTKVAEALEGLPCEKPEVLLVEDEDPFIFSTAGRRAHICLSSTLLSLLTVEQLRAALAHEIAHIARSRRPLLAASYFLRMVMFFNPVVLMEFRRAVQEDEKICDRMAVSLTGKPAALAETLGKLYLPSLEAGDPGSGKLSDAVDNVERYGHRLNIESRIRRLERGLPSDPRNERIALALTVAAAAAVNYFVV
jgi:hypothetical protein